MSAEYEAAREVRDSLNAQTVVLKRIALALEEIATMIDALSAYQGERPYALRTQEHVARSGL